VLVAQTNVTNRLKERFSSLLTVAASSAAAVALIRRTPEKACVFFWLGNCAGSVAPSLNFSGALEGAVLADERDGGSHSLCHSSRNLPKRLFQ
jgi:hypothetical protein